MKTFLMILNINFTESLIEILGGYDFPIYSLLLIVGLDAITRFSSYIYFRKININKLIMWFIRNIGIFVIISLAVLFESFLGDGTMIRDVVIYTFSINKIITILEMWKNMGIKLPSIIVTTLEKIKALR